MELKSRGLPPLERLSNDLSIEMHAITLLSARRLNKGSIMTTNYREASIRLQVFANSASLMEGIFPHRYLEYFRNKRHVRDEDLAAVETLRNKIVEETREEIAQSIWAIDLVERPKDEEMQCHIRLQEELKQLNRQKFDDIFSNITDKVTSDSNCQYECHRLLTPSPLQATDNPTIPFTWIIDLFRDKLHYMGSYCASEERALVEDPNATWPALLWLFICTTYMRGPLCKMFGEEFTLGLPHHPMRLSLGAKAHALIMFLRLPKTQDGRPNLNLSWHDVTVMYQYGNVVFLSWAANVVLSNYARDELRVLSADMIKHSYPLATFNGPHIEPVGI